MTKYTKIAVLMLLVLCSASTAFAQKAPRAEGRRSFYLTPSTANGAQAPFACVPGFHMASLWEILDPSNLKYDTTLGYTWQDSGLGPPNLWGWVRTAESSESTVGLAGAANCSAYTLSSEYATGTVVRLNSDWNSPARVAGPWYGIVRTCNLEWAVWCVQD